MRRKNILLVGATGTLGHYITELLREDLPVAKIISASRSADTRGELEHRPIDLLDPATFSSALQDVDVLIHAAGPFNHDPTEIVTQCLACGIHYIDIAEDRLFIEKVHQAAGLVSNASACAVTGCSTMPAMVSLFSQKFIGLDGLNAINIYLSLGAANPVSYGLMNGLLHPLGKPLMNEEKCFRKLFCRRHRDGIKKQYGNYIAPFSEGISIGGKKVPLSFHVGFDLPYINTGLRFGSYLVPHLSHQGLNRLTRLLLLPAGVVRRLGGTEGRLVIEARNDQGAVLDEIEIIAKQDGLKLPSAPAVWATKALLSMPAKTFPAGVIDLPAIISIADAVAWIRSHSYEVHIVERYTHHG